MSFSGASQIYLGNPGVAPMNLRKRSNVGPLFFSAAVEWNKYIIGSYMACRLIVPPANQLDIRSVHIDNSMSAAPCSLIFPDTGYTITAPAFGTTTETVVTQGSEAILYCLNPPFIYNIQGRTNKISASTTQVYMLNVELPPASVPAPTAFVAPFKRKDPQVFYRTPQGVAVNTGLFNQTIDFSDLGKDTLIDIKINATPSVAAAPTPVVPTDWYLEFMDPTATTVIFTAPYTDFMTGPIINANSIQGYTYPSWSSLCYSNNGILPPGAPPIEQWGSYRLRLQSPTCGSFIRYGRVCFIDGARMAFPLKMIGFNTAAAADKSFNYAANTLTEFFGSCDIASGSNPANSNIFDARVYAIGSASSTGRGWQGFFPALGDGQDVINNTYALSGMMTQWI